MVTAQNIDNNVEVLWSNKSSSPVSTPDMPKSNFPVYVLPWID